ncbi:hypothetical protein N9V19_00220 [Opitutales bacterium]|nr:hypothetical protein [Opitutales bacterium]MDB2310405.1 hypothetical protein [Opitutales bacterium]MDB2357615.1 hypothetical protein [Opitutales bacterium]
MSNRQKIQPYWRPNFKIKSSLPDIKVVRTGFIVNFVIITFVLIAIFSLLHRQYYANSLRTTIDLTEARVRQAEPEDRLRLENSERFRKAAQSIEELERFYRAPYFADEFLINISQLKPEGLIFSRLSFSERVIEAKVIKKKTKIPARMTYNINIAGEVSELIILTEFKAAIEASPLMNPEGYSVVVDESIQQRSAETGITPFQLRISLMVINLEPSVRKGGQG